MYTSKNVVPTAVVDNDNNNEQLFNNLYGCHIYKSPSADVVHVVNEDHSVYSIRLTESFNMYDFHTATDGSIQRDGVLADGAHLAAYGATSPLFHKHLDEDGSLTRKTIGLLVDWRRSYVINTMFNALLLAIMLNITGVLGEC